MPHFPNQVLGRPTMSSSGKIVTGTFSTKCFSALAQRSTSGWLSVALNDSVNRTARSKVTRTVPYARMASYILTTRSVAVPCRSVAPLAMACSCADKTAAVLLIWIS